MQEATIVDHDIPALLRHSVSDLSLTEDRRLELRAASLIERQQQVIDLLMKAVEPFAEVAASDRIIQLSDDDLTDDVDFACPP